MRNDNDMMIKHSYILKDVSDWMLAGPVISTVYDQPTGQKQAVPEHNKCNVHFACFAYKCINKLARLTQSTNDERTS